MAVLQLCTFLLTTVLSVMSISMGLREEGYERGRLTDLRPRRDIMGVLGPASRMGADEEYGGQVGPLNKRPFGSLFNMKGLSSNGILEEEEEQIVPEEDNEILNRRYPAVVGGGYKFGKRGNFGHVLGSGYSLGKRPLGGLLGIGGYKFGKRGLGGLLGGGYKLGKRGMGGLGGILGGGYKFGKRGLGGVLGGGYKFGKRDEEHEAEDDSMNLVKRPWGNLFNRGFQFGKRETPKKNPMANIYEALLSRRQENEDSGQNGRVMQGALSMAKRLFGNVLSGGYKLG